MSRFPVGTNKR